RFVPERIELKFKLSQNHPTANVRAAAAALSGQGDSGAMAIAALMLERVKAL
ncbi:MAG TPA: FMN-binding negative transcriptional regulator, partial [Pseudoxanthomonas sp.]|nr:FMN-binding negative transcriptional regulator [Pseudoxanthomonas sp.]